MPQIRLVCDDKEKVARLFINTVSPEWLPLEAEIILRSPEDELNCPLVKNLSEQDQEILNGSGMTWALARTLKMGSRHLLPIFF